MSKWCHSKVIVNKGLVDKFFNFQLIVHQIRSKFIAIQNTSATYMAGNTAETALQVPPYYHHILQLHHHNNSSQRAQVLHHPSNAPTKPSSPKLLKATTQNTTTMDFFLNIFWIKLNRSIATDKVFKWQVANTPWGQNWYQFCQQIKSQFPFSKYFLKYKAKP